MIGILSMLNQSHRAREGLWGLLFLDFQHCKFHHLYSFSCFSKIDIDFSFSDVKIKREHVKGSDDLSGNIKPEIEPITEDTVRRMENPGSVEVCKSSSANKNWLWSHCIKQRRLCRVEPFLLQKRMNVVCWLRCVRWKFAWFLLRMPKKRWYAKITLGFIDSPQRMEMNLSRLVHLRAH